MEVVFIFVLIALMALALGSGFPVAFALPGSAIIAIAAAALTGYVLEGTTDAYFAVGGPAQWLSAGVTNLRGVYWEVERDTLIAIPLFIFMGIMLQRSKIAEDLLVAMAQLFGPIPGGLGIAVVFVGALLAATTGIVGATVVAMGLISLPAMMRNGYSKPLATGTIAASGTLGQIIPPSIVLIILADQLASATDQASNARKALHKAATGEISMPSELDVSGTSAGEMFLGAFVPGMLLVGLYMAFILGFAILRPKLAPAVPFEGERNARFWGRTILILVPPLALIFLVLGSIIAGVATVNQAGAIGAAGALIMAGYRLREDAPGAYTPAIIAVVSLIALYVIGENWSLNIKALGPEDDQTGLYLALAATAALLASLVWSGIRVMNIEQTLQGVMLETAKTTSLVFIILLGAAVLTAAFRAFGGEEIVRHFLQGLPGGFWTQFVIVMAVIFVLGFFLDFIEIAVVVVPIVAPILLADPTANITAVWLGVMIGLNIQTSFLTPPFGFALFYLRGVAPAAVKTTDIYKGVIAFISLQLIGLMVVGLYPPLVNYLPNRVGLTAETAPPPRNPRLQMCLEEDALARIEDNGGAIRSAISDARRLDLSYLPERTAKALSESFDSAEEALRLLPEAGQAADRVQTAAVEYRPLHDRVRLLERDIGRAETEAKELQTSINRTIGEGPRIEAEKAEKAARIETLMLEAEELRGRIPAEWDAAYKTFAEINREEQNLRRQYRRAGEDAASPALETLTLIRAVDALRDIRPALEAFRDRIGQAAPADLVDPVSELRSAVGEIDGASDVRSAVNDARKTLRSDDPDEDLARAALDEAIAELDAELAWRSRAEQELAPGLQAYVGGIGSSIGVRALDRMPNDVALAVAACEASHRNLSLNF
ncbi:TRAP transporter, DctM subunit [Albimonas donghaensis]|uniref:TRAP transporter, DctM subunit n=1 Tax=Albimonas donghaensis TaxID=356660 RepID=A0A1H3CCB8_9RHOB|nr:SLC13 family permease [Albimonas donghaensis]SDX51548.1 TRAP transporter, DctM subunit [Albimonas donghaensis]